MQKKKKANCANIPPFQIWSFKCLFSETKGCSFGWCAAVCERVWNRRTWVYSQAVEENIEFNYEGSTSIVGRQFTIRLLHKKREEWENKHVQNATAQHSNAFQLAFSLELWKLRGLCICWKAWTTVVWANGRKVNMVNNRFDNHNIEIYFISFASRLRTKTELLTIQICALDKMESQSTQFECNRRNNNCAVICRVHHSSKVTS